MGTGILAAIVLLAVVAIIVAFVQSERVKLSAEALDFLKRNFDKLVDKRVSGEAVVTIRSLNSYRGDTKPLSRSQVRPIDELIKNVRRIGHVIEGSDKTAAAATIAASTVSPMGAAVSAVSLLNYGISKADIARYERRRAA